MIECSTCNSWAHRACASMTREQYDNFAADGVTYMCPHCMGRKSDSTSSVKQHSISKRKIVVYNFLCMTDVQRWPSSSLMSLRWKFKIVLQLQVSRRASARWFTIYLLHITFGIGVIQNNTRFWHFFQQYLLKDMKESLFKCASFVKFDKALNNETLSLCISKAILKVLTVICSKLLVCWP